jgi:large subunit ribosomal protein L6
VALPSGVTVEITSGFIVVKGSKGELKTMLLPEVSVATEGSEVKVTRKDNSDNARARHGLTRMLINSMAIGVSQGFEKKLEIIGVGYKAVVKGKILVLNLGHSHPINFDIPAGIEMSTDEKNKNLLSIRGIDKQLVGQVSANIRSLRPPEPYKGKGVRYQGENVRRKAGKAATAKAA